MKHQFRGVEYTIRRGKTDTDADGETEHSRRETTISKDLDPHSLRFLETVLHEALHDCVPDLAEKAVGETARDIALLLRRMGYRRRRKK